MGDNKPPDLKGQLSSKTNSYSQDPSRRVLLDVYEMDENNKPKIKKEVKNKLGLYESLMILSIIILFISITLYFVFILIPQYKIQTDTLKYKRFLGGTLSKKARQQMCSIS